MKPYSILTFLLFLSGSISSFGQVLTDAQLYKKGYDEVQKQNWSTASAYLFAYIQRNPVDFLTDKNYENQVREAFNTCNQNMEKEKIADKTKIEQLYAAIKDLETRSDERRATSSIAGLDIPELPQLKPPIQQLSILSQQTTPINGQWQATLTSSSGSVFNGTLLIVSNEDVITGIFTLSDNSSNKVSGMYDGENLVLIRNTGITTLQNYVLKKLDDDHFSGSYKNEGKIPDDGNIVLAR